MKSESSLRSGLQEKYLHSRAALRFKEGRCDAAIRLYKKALTLDDQAFTHAGLSDAYAAKGNLKGAVKEISLAIARAPGVAEYLSWRGMLLERLGQTAKAKIDRARALKIDPESARAEPVKRALMTIEEAFSFPGKIEPYSPHSPELAVISRERAEERLAQYRAVDCRSCIVPCPAYCCHFSKATLLHGLFFGAWKLYAVRNYFKERGIKEEKFLTRYDITNADQRLHLIPPDRMLPEAGHVRVYFPKRGRKPLGHKLAKSRPMGRGYSDIAWITKDSRPCAFLSERRCMIHDTGDEAALTSCKEFLCFTGFIFLVLDHEKVVERNALDGREIAELNLIALDAALLLADQLYADESLKEREKDLAQTFDEAICADVSGNERLCRQMVDRYRQKKEEYAVEKARRIEELRKDVRLLLVH
jgi:tetratricopeptide (TPR) repeat protein